MRHVITTSISAPKLILVSPGRYGNGPPKVDILSDVRGTLWRVKGNLLHELVWATVRDGEHGRRRVISLQVKIASGSTTEA